MKQTIRLTESELRTLIEESVNEALMDEGFFDGLGALGNKFKNKAKRDGQNLATKAGGVVDKVTGAVKNAYGQAKGAVQGAMDKAGTAVQNTKDAVKDVYKNTKKTYQVGSANGDAQKAVKNALQSLQNLYTANEKMQQAGMSNIIGNKQQSQTIQDAITALKQIAGRFQSTVTSMTK